MSTWHGRSLAWIGCTAAFWIPLAAVAAGSTPAKSMNVTVLPDRYLVAGKQVGLDALESTVKKNRVQAVRLDVCGAANERLLAAAARLNALYLDIRPVAPGTRGCPPSAADTADSARISPNLVRASTGDPSAQYWRSVLP
jgi:hypothetical protein